MVDYVSMGKRIRAKRRILHMSQEDVAKAINISPSFYGNIERGIRIPSIDTLVAIANELEVGVDFLLADSVDAVSSHFTKEEARTVTRFLREKVAELIFDDPEQQEQAGELPEDEETE